MTILEALIEAFKALGGQGNYKSIYEAYSKITGENIDELKTPSIRRTIETHSSDSEAFSKNYDDDYFYAPNGLGNGFWGLRTPKTNYYFVSQNKTHFDENNKSYLWAPLVDKSGNTNWSYELNKNVKKGDVIIHYNNGHIPGVSIAKEDAYESLKPNTLGDTSDAWKLNGYKIDVEQYFTSSPLDKSLWADYFIENQPKSQGPLASNKNVNQAYLFQANRLLVEKILQEMEKQKANIELVEHFRIKANQPKFQLKDNYHENTYPNLAENYEVTQMPKEKQIIEQINSYISSKGFTYDNKLIENLYLSLKSKPFVILAGTSGTGKSKLAKLFAESINAEYKLVPVRPDWSDSSDLFGHLDLEGNFVPGALTEFIAKANSNLSKPHILCLDEMNLARVEYYLSDFLSIIETRHFENDTIKTDPLLTKTSYGNDSTGAYEKYGDLSIPENLYVIGTVNMDETTFPFSKKVLDRANTIEFSTVNLTFPENLSITSKNIHYVKDVDNSFLRSKYLILQDCLVSKDYLSKICMDLEKLNKILLKANLHVGYRVRDEIAFYMVNNRLYDLLSENDAFDNAIMQKILPRIQGSSNTVKTMLYTLFNYCIDDAKGIQTEQDSGSDYLFGIIQDEKNKRNATNPESKIDYLNSAEKIAFMIRRFEEDGFTSFWL